VKSRGGGDTTEPPTLQREASCGPPGESRGAVTSANRRGWGSSRSPRRKDTVRRTARKGKETTHEFPKGSGEHGGVSPRQEESWSRDRVRQRTKTSKGPRREIRRGARIKQRTAECGTERSSQPGQSRRGQSRTKDLPGRTERRNRPSKKPKRAEPPTERGR